MDKPSIDINFNTYPNIGIFTVGSSSYHLNKNDIPLLHISSRTISSGDISSRIGGSECRYTEYSVLERQTTNFIYTSKKRDNIEAFNDCVKFINLFYKAINREFTDVQYNASGVSASSTGSNVEQKIVPNTVQKIVPNTVQKVVPNGPRNIDLYVQYFRSIKSKLIIHLAHIDKTMTFGNIPIKNVNIRQEKLEFNAVNIYNNIVLAGKMIRTATGSEKWDDLVDEYDYILDTYHKYPSIKTTRDSFYSQRMVGWTRVAAAPVINITGRLTKDLDDILLETYEIMAIDVSKLTVNILEIMTEMIVSEVSNYIPVSCQMDAIAYVNNINILHRKREFEDFWVPPPNDIRPDNSPDNSPDSTVACFINQSCYCNSCLVSVHNTRNTMDIPVLTDYDDKILSNVLCAVEMNSDIDIKRIKFPEFRNTLRDVYDMSTKSNNDTEHKSLETISGDIPTKDVVLTFKKYFIDFGSREIWSWYRMTGNIFKRCMTYMPYSIDMNASDMVNITKIIDSMTVKNVGFIINEVKKFISNVSPIFAENESEIFIDSTGKAAITFAFLTMYRRTDMIIHYGPICEVGVMNALESVSLRFIESSDDMGLNEIGTIWGSEPNPTDSVNIDFNHSDISECCDVHDMLLGTMSNIIKQEY